MHVISRPRIIDFWKENPDAEQPLKSWYAEAKKARWRTPNQIKANYASASMLKNQRVVFNIAGNKYRLVVKVLYKAQTVYIRFIGNHADYDKIDAETI